MKEKVKHLLFMIMHPSYMARSLPTDKRLDNLIYYCIRNREKLKAWFDKDDCNLYLQLENDTWSFWLGFCNSFTCAHVSHWDEKVTTYSNLSAKDRSDDVIPSPEAQYAFNNELVRYFRNRSEVGEDGLQWLEAYKD